MDIVWVGVANGQGRLGKVLLEAKDIQGENMLKITGFKCFQTTLQSNPELKPSFTDEIFNLNL